MKRVLSIIVVLLALSAAFAFANGTTEKTTASQPAAATMAPVTIAMWTQESESEGSYQYIQSLIGAYTGAHSNVTINLVQKDTEALRQDFLTASLAGEAPDLLWTVNDHAGPFITANTIQPLEKLFDMSKYVESVVMQGHTWAVPISSGNHLMLLYNKSMVPTPPKTTDELVSIGKTLTHDGQYALAYNAVEPFWLVPWLGGFGGQVFAQDGVTPTLDTPAMRNTLQFLSDLKVKYGIVPAESDYATMDTMFKDGKAAMIINGDWSLGEYSKLMGANLGIANIPKVSSTGKWPAPYTSGKYYMIAQGVSGAKLNAIHDFVVWSTNLDNQTAMVKTLTRLPGLKAALSTDLVKNDPILSASSAQMAVGTPMPSVVEMRAVWDAMKPEMNAVLAGKEDATAASKAMQSAAVAGIQSMK